MKATPAVACATLLFLIAGPAYAPTNHVSGSDSLNYFSGPLRLPSCFTNLFITNRAIIAIEPAANEFIFFANETVAIMSAARIEVYRLTYGGETTQVVNRASPVMLKKPVPGHYFVQSGNDRAEFVVFPSNYRTLENVGHDDDYVRVYSGMPDRAKLRWVRVIADWQAIQTNHGAAFNWAAPGNTFSLITRLNRNSGKAKIILCFGLAGWAYDYPFEDWLTDFTNFVAAAHAKFGKNSSIVRLGPISEASGGNVNAALTDNYGALAKRVYQAVSIVWPGIPQIGPSESSPGSGLPSLFKEAGADAYLDAVDYHDYYNGYGNSDGDPDSPVFGVVAGRAGRNLSALGKTNIFVTELGLLGASSLGYLNDPNLLSKVNPVNLHEVASLPSYGWYRGLTRVMRTVVLYAQYRAILFYHAFATGGAEEIFGIEGNGIKPKTSAFLMTSYWLNGSDPVTNWVSGNFHFATSVWSNGATNTFVWAGEGTSMTTNLGVTITDVWSNRWTGAIGEEPVIAWGWPRP